MRSFLNENTIVLTRPEVSRTVSATGWLMDSTPTEDGRLVQERLFWFEFTIVWEGVCPSREVFRITIYRFVQYSSLPCDQQADLQPVLPMFLPKHDAKTELQQLDFPREFVIRLRKIAVATNELTAALPGGFRGFVFRDRERQTSP